MANTRISQLPSYTGTAADSRWFVMNNSGQTETFKFTGFTSQLIPGTGPGVTYRTLTATAAGTDSIAIGGAASVPGGLDNMAIGHNARNTAGNRSTAIGSEAVVGDAATALGWGAQATVQSAVALGYGTVASGSYSMAIGESANATATYAIVIGANQNCSVAQSTIVGGRTNQIAGSGSYNSIFGSFNSNISGTTNYSSILGGNSNALANKTNAHMIGCSGRTASTSSATFVENLVVFNYAGLNFADDTAAAAGGVVLGQIYHNSGDLKIRIV